MQITLPIIFPFSCIARFSSVECFFGRSNRHCNSKCTMLFYVVIFFFIFFPCFIKSVEAEPLKYSLQIMNKNIFCPFVFIENAQESHVEADSFFFKATFYEIRERFFEVRIFLFKFLPFCFDFVIPNCNEGTDKETDNTKRYDDIIPDSKKDIVNNTHQFSDLETFLLIVAPPIVFIIVWHVVNYIYAERKQ